ncbi:MAG: flagellar biosynthetic protein FliO [bacterium]|nr:flagellar biosynthetic protein FliO [bacterium]
MTQYLFKFIFYTTGVIGILLIAYVVAKNFLSGAIITGRKKGNLEIEETLSLSPRKTLHIVRAFDEKFLVASDASSTTLLAKLNSDGEIIEENNNNVEEFSNYLEPKNQTKQTTKKSGSVIHSMLEKLNN